MEACTPVVITTWPGAGNQPWHRDFGKAAAKVSLVPCLRDNGLGPTEFLVASHRIAAWPSCRKPAHSDVERVGRVHEWVGWLLSLSVVRVAVTTLNSVFDLRLPVPVPTRALVPAGAMVVFDCRVLHRGRENKSANSKRPIVSFDYQ